ncbi:TPA: hypothetical protein OTX98_002096 [Klebsiella aerogenes]|nr:hypothetical protein [Klebsiella aerogenes]
MNKISIFFGLTCALLLTGCGSTKKDAGYPVKKLSGPQWRWEIQKRFDAANPNANQAVCIITDRRLRTKFSGEIRPSAGTPWFIKHDLVEEIKQVNELGITFFYYRLTDKGAASSPNWPYSWRTGLCFGNIQVENVNTITPAMDQRTTKVEFIYHINNVPEWGQELMLQLFPNAIDGKITGCANFDMVDRTQLRSQSGISNYYIEENELFNSDITNKTLLHCQSGIENHYSEKEELFNGF